MVVTGDSIRFERQTMFSSANDKIVEFSRVNAVIRLPFPCQIAFWKYMPAV